MWPVGLDLYAGPLTRYHAGTWLTVAQQAGQRLGVPVEILRAEPTGRAGGRATGRTPGRGGGQVRPGGHVGADRARASTTAAAADGLLNIPDPQPRSTRLRTSTLSGQAVKSTTTDSECRA